MLLESVFPNLPPIAVAIMYIIGGIGAILITYGVFLEQERRQDLVKFVGAACIFVYALFRGDLLIQVAMAGLGIASLVEFIEIYIGLHKHGAEDLKRYKALR